jgi:hypothetical protein
MTYFRDGSVKDWQYWHLSVSMASAAADPAYVGRRYTVIGGIPLARPNFKYEKRQKELAKQKKAEEKRLRKMEKRNGTADEELTEPLDHEEQPAPVAGETPPE